MFSPSEYLTNLRQITLLNGLVTPQGQLPAVPQVPKIVSTPGIPVVATIHPITGQCNDIIRTVASSPLALGVAAAVAGALVLTFLIKKHGAAILQWFRSHAQQFLSSIKAKLKKQRTVALLPPAQTLVMG